MTLPNSILIDTVSGYPIEKENVSRRCHIKNCNKVVTNSHLVGKNEVLFLCEFHGDNVLIEESLEDLVKHNTIKAALETIEKSVREAINSGGLGEEEVRKRFDTMMKEVIIKDIIK